MTPGAIEGANILLLGNSDDVQDLPAVRTEDGEFVTAWYPTPTELAALNRGNPVYLFIIGSSHPPVRVGVKA